MVGKRVLPNTNKQEIRNKNFAPILNTVIQDVISIPMLQNAFGACGLFPFNASAIDYSKLVTGEVNIDKAQNKNNCDVTNLIPDSVDFTSHLKFIESFIEPKKIVEFENFISKESAWSGQIQDESLFILWKKLKEHVANKTEKVLQNKDNNDEQSDLDTIHITGDLILKADWLDDLNIMNNTTETIKIIEALANETDLNKPLATEITDILNHSEIDEEQLNVSGNYVADKLIEDKV